MKRTGIFCQFKVLLPACLLLVACSSQKETVTSRGMQNLTARYNILYNASRQFKESWQTVLDAVPDDYSQTLSIYKEPRAAPAGGDKALDSVLLRARTIIAAKAQSNYVDDAWMLIGKVNYLKAEFFNAAEYFDYIYKTYYDDKLLRQEALFWKARSLMRLKDMDAAAVALDSAMKHPLGSDRAIADVYAAEAQFNILSGNGQNAITQLKKALKTGSSKENTIRWNYVLAQLEEENGDPEAAWVFYTAVVKSNASFEMAFNANLNRMRLKGSDGTPEGKIASLKSLLKQYKNRDFMDRIYFLIAEIYTSEGKKELALQNYQLGLAASTVNANQKGLIYLKLADLNFKEADYVKAKSYYDSTLASLSPAFPGYESIRIKSANLDFLSGRLKEISMQDTLQMLSKLPEPVLPARAGTIVREQLRRSGTIATQPGPFTAAIDAGRNTAGSTEGKFYFNNLVAIGQGFNDFKRKWGNRKLEDNWRRGNNGGADIQALNTGNQATNSNSVAPGGSSPAEELLVRELMNAIPVSEAQRKESDQKIINAYYDIAGFYKDELKDNAEAIKTYRLLLSRYPENSYKPSVYYNLYKLYLDTDQATATEYSNLLIREFPESLYAKVLADPEYSRKADLKASALNQAYNDTYQAYNLKKYREVEAAVAQTELKYGKNNLSPQFAYLGALAKGHLHKIDSLEQSFSALVAAYPNDQVVAPMVSQQLAFIKQNREMLEKRPVALLEAGNDYLVQAALMEPAENVAVNAARAPVVEKAPPAKVTEEEAPQKLPATDQPLKTAPAIQPESNAVVATEEPAAKPAPLYELPETADYYFVINVNDARVNLNPSRFGLGQFIRSKYQSAGIGHTSRVVNNENQLVFVGRFSSLQAVKAYEARIRPLMNDIMKVPAEKYNTFVITGKELDKLTGRDEIDRYADFYRHQN